MPNLTCETTFEHKPRSAFVDFSASCSEKLLGTIGLLILIFMIIIASTPLLATHDVNKQRLVKRLKGPSAEYLLGTDNYGRFHSRLSMGHASRSA